MARCYSEAMPRLKPLPAIWLVSDARNDAVLEAALARLPRGSGLVFRHYHLDEAARRARFDALRGLCRTHGHLAVLSDQAALAAAWGADGVYGPARQLGAPDGLLRLATAHDPAEVAAANRAGVDGLFLSPVFPSRTHPGASHLGPDGFRALAALAQCPVIALGGMDADRAQQLGAAHWAGIDAFLR